MGLRALLPGKNSGAAEDNRDRAGAGTVRSASRSASNVVRRASSSAFAWRAARASALARRAVTEARAALASASRFAVS